MTEKSTFLKKDVKRSFNQAADTYDSSAFLQREVADRLLERLSYIRIDPKMILDLGTGTGYSAVNLEKRYKRAKIIAVDIAEQMLQFSRNKNKRWFDHKRYICADAEKLPFQDNSFDLVVSNLMLHWSSNIENTIAEIRRVLRQDGLFLFSTLGPDTLFELKQSWATIDDRVHVHKFLDMHHLGDFLLKNQFQDPVMDMEFITINYNDLRKIFLDLKNLGTQNIAKHRFKGLTGKKKFDHFIKAYEKHRNPEGFIPLTYEVIYGIGWGKERVKNEAKEVSIPIESIKRSPQD